MDRQQIRVQKRQQRRNLTEDERKKASISLTQQILRSTIFKNSKRIAFYLPNDGEIDLYPLLVSAWRHNKQCFLPVLGPHQSHKLWFLPVTPETNFVKNRYGILEPEHTKTQRMFKCISLNLILMPLVAFDIQGNRLGMGGGYYDRTLSSLRTRTIWNKPHLMGTAYTFQEFPALKKQKWDIPLHSIATEKAIFKISRNKS